jgi:excinuclease UvrABC nuclease subunit
MKINLPTKEELLTEGLIIPISLKGEGWSKKCLGDYRKKSGVYLHHCDGEIIYIGKATAGKRGNFGDRMRREFHETSASNDYLHRFIKAHLECVRTKFLDLDQIDGIVDGEGVELSRERKALILEQILIGQYEPKGNRV